MRLAMSGLLAAVILAGCGTLGGAGEPLIRAYRLPADPTAVMVEFSGCEAEPPRRVEEDAETVTVTLDGPNGGCEPLHHLTFSLDAPLGDRSVIDGSRGRAVPVEDLPQD